MKLNRNTIVTFLLMFVISFLYTAKIAYSTTLPSKLTIEAPITNTITGHASITISGWAISSKGVSKVQILIDNVNKGYAIYGLARADIGKTYSKYPNAAKAGFTFDVANLPVGSHKITVISYNVNGTKLTRYVYVKIVKLTMRMSLTTPTVNANITSNLVTVSGWALNPVGVKNVEVYLDGKLQGNANYGTSSTYTNSLYPGYDNGKNAGFTYILDLKPLTLGKHTLTIKAIGKDVTSQQLTRSFTLKGKLAFSTVEAPANNAEVIGNSVIINGFSLSPVGVKSVKIYIDGVLKGTAKYGISRTDVATYYPGYLKSGTSGFTYSLDLKSYKLGKHKITVAATSLNGTVKSSESYFNLSKKAVMMDIEAPKEGYELSGNSLDVTGWSLNPAGVDEVEVYLDGDFVGQADAGLKRNDINNKYPGFPDGDKSGYSYSLDLKGAILGKHKVSIVSVGNDGSRQQLDRNITILKKVAVTTIESPTINQSITDNTLSLTGFSISPVGIKSVQVYFDEKLLGNATYSITRTDISRAYVGFLNAGTSGFRYTYDMKSIAAGTHKVAVVATANDLTTKKVELSFKIYRKEPVLAIETPVTGTTSTARNMTISGYALNDSQIKEVQYYMNGTLLSKGTDGIARADVDSSNPGYVNGATSGISYSFNVMKLLNTGTTSVTFKTVAIGYDGTSSTVEKTVSLNKLAEAINIDAPTASAIVKNSLKVNGWALNASGVTDVKVYLDNVLKAAATYGGERADVASVYPGYTDADKSGFTYTFSSNGIASGNHSLKIIATGADGKTISKAVTFNMYGIINYENYKYKQSYLANLEYNYIVNGVHTQVWGNTSIAATLAQITEYTKATSDIVDDANYRYQFLNLDYFDGVSVDDLNKALLKKGILENKGQVFLDAGKRYNVNPIYLVAHALLETGNGTSALSTGILVSSVNGVAVTPKTVYNMFGIQAIDANPNKYGSEYAYAQGWDTVDKAIIGGAYWIGASYINNATYKQNTLYKMRWNPASPKVHQYATDVRWARNQVTNIQKIISLCTNSVLYYNVPVFLPE